MPDQSPPLGVPGRDANETRAIQGLQDALGDDFEVKRLLGRGSMAAVYLAREKPLNRFVAVKVLHSGTAEDRTARLRFEREARAAASLSHPNVVQVFRYGELPNGTPYLVMRFVKGRTMEERLKAEGRLPVDLARQILVDVTSGLAAAHAQGIVHRDVRPANVLWDEDHGAALLTDFGIAAVLATSGEDVTRLTKSGQMIGDPRYLSPEQLLDKDLTELADMYALGVMGYELLTGEGPYEARTSTQWITAHLNAEPRDLRRLRPDVDPDVADLLRRCLNREPNHRPSAADASRVLRGEAAAAVPAVEEGPVTGLDQLLKRRVPQFLIASAAAAGGFLGFVGLLVEMGTLGPTSWDLSLRFAACALAAAAVVAWFHGERGRQRTNVLEWMLLSVIAVVWLALSIGVVVSG